MTFLAPLAAPNPGVALVSCRLTQEGDYFKYHVKDVLRNLAIEFVYLPGQPVVATRGSGAWCVASWWEEHVYQQMPQLRGKGSAASHPCLGAVHGNHALRAWFTGRLLCSGRQFG